VKHSIVGLSGLAISLFATSLTAQAADLPYKIPVPACAQFSGFYLGGNVGWVHYNASVEDQDNFVAWPFTIGGTTTYSGSRNAFAGGPQAGYNFQRHCMVAGFEADWSWTNAHANSLAHPNVLNLPTSLGTVDSKLQSFGTLRTRAGIVVDQALLYVTGGLAWMEARHTVANVFPGVPGEQFTLSGTRWGGVAGFGVEYALTSNFSIKSEALYLATADKTETVQANSLINRCTTNGATCQFKTNDSAWVARVGVNYRFN
jgi:opacity protein-like surface antigen